MDGSSEQFTIRHIGLWALSLYPGRDFLPALFPDYPTMGVNKPVIVAEYGIDAYDTSAWYITCVNSTYPDSEKCVDSEEGYAYFVSEEKQSDWTVSLVESLERHSTSCESGCMSKVTSGGTVTGWTDELWKGRVIDSISLDDRSRAMTCPESDANKHSICGYPAIGQPDDFVNEEWFGMHAVASVCQRNIAQLRPRLVWHGLKRLWNDGSCTSNLDGVNAYSTSEYPLCSTMMRTLRLLWMQERTLTLEERENHDRSNIDWMLALEQMATKLNGDSDCELMQLLHDTKPDLCPAAPAHMISWPEQVLTSPDRNRTYPAQCDEDDGILPFNFVVLVLLAVLAVFGLGVLLVFTRWTLVKKACACAGSCGNPFSRRDQVKFKRSLRIWKKRHVPSIGGGWRSTCQLVSRVEATPPKSPVEDADRLWELPLNEQTFVFVRQLLQPLALRMCTLFGFQGSQNAGEMRVPSNAANAVELVASLLFNQMGRVGTRGGMLVKLSSAVNILHETVLSNYATWCRHLGFARTQRSDEGKLQQLVLWHLIWGEAANLRLMPELLSFIFHCADSALDFSGNDTEAVHSFPVPVPPQEGTKESSMHYAFPETLQVRQPSVKSCPIAIWQSRLLHCPMRSCHVCTPLPAPLWLNFVKERMAL